MTYDPKHEARALDALAKDMGLTHSLSLDRQMHPYDHRGFVILAASLVATAMDCRQEAAMTAQDKERLMLAVQSELIAVRTIREGLLAIKPHVTTLHALLQQIEPREEIDNGNP